MTTAIRRVLSIVSWIAACVCLGAAASGQQASSADDASPFDGEWTVTFSVSSPPGGYQLTAGVSSVSPGHLHYRIEKRFTVERDGRISLQGADAGTFHHHQTVHYEGKVGTYRWDQQALCKITGVATATPNGPEARQPYTRRLELTIEWAAGNGTEFFQTELGTFAGAVYVSDDGTQVIATRPFGLPPFSQPLAYWSSKWQMTPANDTVDEISPDVLQERVTYSSTRETVLEPATGQAKGLERIEIRHVRQMGLVPRG